jgi:hypothetical protein
MNKKNLVWECFWDPEFEKIAIKYKLEYFGLDVQMEVVHFEFFILFILLESPMLLWIFYQSILNLKFINSF